MKTYDDPNKERTKQLFLSWVQHSNFFQAASQTKRLPLQGIENDKSFYHRIRFQDPKAPKPLCMGQQTRIKSIYQKTNKQGLNH